MNKQVGASSPRIVAGHPPLSPALRALWWLFVALLLAWLLAGSWALWQVLTTGSGGAASGSGFFGGARAQIADLEQQVATLTRSDQITRQANTDLQGTLAERDEEISGLRADVAFYERFVGSTAQRRGLNVHKLQLQAQGGPAWKFTATLTQNLNRGAVNAGRVQVDVEGNRAGKPERLGWSQLRPAGDAGVAYSFKYFQEVEGSIALPDGFTPTRMIVHVIPQGGGPVDQAFGWADALGSSKDDAGAGG